MKYKIVVALIVGFVILLFGGIHFYFFEFKSSFWESLSINLLSNLILLIFLVFVIDVILSKHEKEQETQEYFYVFKSRHQLLLTLLEDEFIALIKKKTLINQFSKEDELNELLNNFDSFFEDEFMEKSNIVEFEGVEMKKIPFKEYFIDHFIPNVNSLIEEFNKDKNHIPREVFNSLIFLEEALSELHYGDLSKSKNGKYFMPVDPEKLKSNLLKIGKEILNLKEYMEKNK